MCCVECDGECGDELWSEGGGDELCSVREVVMNCEGEDGRSVLCMCAE